jgi:hypothetical protein
MGAGADAQEEIEGLLMDNTPAKGIFGMLPPEIGQAIKNHIPQDKLAQLAPITDAIRSAVPQGAFGPAQEAMSQHMPSPQLLEQLSRPPTAAAPIMPDPMTQMQGMAPQMQQGMAQMQNMPQQFQAIQPVNNPFGRRYGR